MADKKTEEHVLAELISTITNPALLIIVAIGVISRHFASSPIQFWRWWAIGSFLLIGPSLLFSIYTWKKEEKIDVDLTKRQDRLIPLLFATLGAVVGSFLISSRLNSHDMLILSYVLAAMLVALTLITTVWKISLHVTTLTALITLIVVFTGDWRYAWVYLLLYPVAWARLKLKQHTKAQLVAGLLVGLGVTLAAKLIFRS